MTDEANLPFGEASPEAAISTAKPRKHRHQWITYEVFFAGKRELPDETRCPCGAIQDPAASRRGNNNRKRGNAIQRKRITALGGRNLAGNNPNLDGIGQMFGYESKSGGAFSSRYWRWLTDIPVLAGQVQVLIVTEAPGPGHKARSYVVVGYDDWRDLHGEG